MYDNESWEVSASSDDHISYPTEDSASDFLPDDLDQSSDVSSSDDDIPSQIRSSSRRLKIPPRRVINQVISSESEAEDSNVEDSTEENALATLTVSERRELELLSSPGASDDMGKEQLVENLGIEDETVDRSPVLRHSPFGERSMTPDSMSEEEQSDDGENIFEEDERDEAARLREFYEKVQRGGKEPPHISVKQGSVIRLKDEAIYEVGDLSKLNGFLELHRGQFGERAITMEVYNVRIDRIFFPENGDPKELINQRFTIEHDQLSNDINSCYTSCSSRTGNESIVYRFDIRVDLKATNGDTLEARLQSDGFLPMLFPGKTPKEVLVMDRASLLNYFNMVVHSESYQKRFHIMRIAKTKTTSGECVNIIRSVYPDFNHLDNDLY